MFWKWLEVHGGDSDSEMPLQNSLFDQLVLDERCKAARTTGPEIKMNCVKVGCVFDIVWPQI